jgi:type IV pilus assembly protein PilY1
MKKRPHGLLNRLVLQSLLFLKSVLFLSPVFALSDFPLTLDPEPPTNVALTLSVEWPTSNQSAHSVETTQYLNTKAYKGHFDENKCYRYIENTSQRNLGYFAPVGYKNAGNYGCPDTISNNTWSGNFLNYATTTPINIFRKTLTGGYRNVDSITETILQNGWMNWTGVIPFPTVSITDPQTIASVAPVNWSNLCVRVRAMGLRMVFNNCATTPTINNASTTTDAYPTGLNPNTDSSLLYQMYLRVKVCDASNGLALEKNCVRYPNGQYKPVGLMHKYAAFARFAVFSYLNDGGNTRDGGVLRAELDYIGPKKSVSAVQQSVNNPLAEWDADTGRFFDNPRPTDSATTTSETGVTINQSGAINYINKFGLEAKNYLGYDNVSELYYAATRYFRGLPNVPRWTTLTSTMSTKRAQLDGFPMLSSWSNNSIQYGCQKNVILGIGDAGTWHDSSVPGSPFASQSILNELNDSEVNAKIRTNQIGTMEWNTNYTNGFKLPGANLGEYFLVTGQQNTAFIAGLAYDAHTRDQRADINGKQTIDTYWLDILGGGGTSNNQYVLATKYGGFKVPENFDPDTHNNTPLDSAWWSKSGSDISINGEIPASVTHSNTTGDPANYFKVGTPDDMIKNLTEAFSNVFEQNSSVNALALASPTVLNNNSMSYQIDFMNKSWTSNFVGRRVSFDAQGIPHFTTVWDASALLNTQSPRFIATNNRNTVIQGTNNGHGVAFTLQSITNTSLLNSLGVSSERQNVMDYLRGNRSMEYPNGPYRKRTGLLGDMVNAQPVVVAAPNAPYLDSSNPGYSTFKASKSARATVVYFASNDGMLHAFNGSDPALDIHGGKELFAYVPSFVFDGPDSANTSDDLLALSDPEYQHRFYVDATPVVIDINMSQAGQTSNETPNWQTLLVGGLGKGGRGFYALNVTDPVVTDETSLATKVKWEFTDPDMGFSSGKPVIVKTKQYGWVVILTSGYENNNGNGQGYFYIVDPNDGSLLQKISTTVGSQQNPAGLTHAAAFVSNFTDYTADAVYAGDLLGNVWRLDLTAATGNYPVPTRIAQLSDHAGNPQPITSAPLIEIDPETQKRYVMVGTGKLLDETDIGNTSTQSFYALLDGNIHFASLPTITRNQLTPANDLINGLSSLPTTGWYVDFPAGEHMLIESRPFNGYVTFATYQSATDYCGQSGRGAVYALKINTAKSQLNGLARADLSSPPSATHFIRTPDSIIRLLVPNKKGELINVPILLNSAQNAIKELNWRQIRTLN